MTMWKSSRATVEPHSRDTHLIWTPAYNRQLFSQQIATMFSVNTDNGHFSVSESKTSTYRSPHFMDTGYLHTGYFHCHNHVLLVDFIPFSNNDRLLSVKK